MTNEELDKLAADITLIKNDVNIIKAHTQLNANILSLVHSNDLKDIVFNIANSQRLCKALIICKNPSTAKELCEALGVKQPNIRRDVLDRLLGGALLTICDIKGRSESYLRVAYLDLIGFEKLAIAKYPDLR